ncbi:hypothetical protein Q3G72_007166 [Acer saccharum]|nr:hypothetical protein Q3G72_007166 [Acer saccharum]
MRSQKDKRGEIRRSSSLVFGCVLLLRLEDHESWNSIYWNNSPEVDRSRTSRAVAAVNVGQNPNLESNPKGKGVIIADVTDRRAEYAGRKVITESLEIGDTGYGFLNHTWERKEGHMGNVSAGLYVNFDLGPGAVTNPYVTLGHDVGLGRTATQSPELVGHSSDPMGLGELGKDIMENGFKIEAPPAGSHMVTGHLPLNQPAYVVFDAQNSQIKADDPNLVGKWKRRARNQHRSSDQVSGGLVFGKKSKDGNGESVPKFPKKQRQVSSSEDFSDVGAKKGSAGRF